MLALYRKKISKTKCRYKYWVYPLLGTRLETDKFYTLFCELRKDVNEFFKVFSQVIEVF